MVAGPTISAMVARAVLFAAAAQQGIAPAALCDAVGLEPDLVADIDGRIPAAVMGALWEEAGALDPSFGLHLGELAVTTHFALPWHILRAGANIREGVARLIAAWRVFNDIGPPPEFVVSSTGAKDAEAVLRLHTQDATGSAPRHAVEFMATWFVMAVRRATGRDLNPKRIAFAHATSSDTAEHVRIFKCAVAFGAEAAEIVYSNDALEIPLADPDPELAQLLAHQAGMLAAKLPSRIGFASRVREVALPLLSDGELSIETVATLLGAGTRSVQRRLQDEGTSFKTVISELRKDVAMTYLRDQAHSLAEVAILLGFSDQASFHRAFVRWTGSTPGAVRRGAR
jgi:AraC-like DNA-binding protein